MKFGRYELIRRVSCGGTAEIFKAKAEGARGFEKIVALKRLLPHGEENPDFIRMFLTEAKLVAQLEHPLIAKTYEIGDVGGSHFIAMEYIYGQNLQQVFDQLRTRQQVAAPKFVAAVGWQAAQALAYTHEFVDDDDVALQIVHRDISPQNLMLCHEGPLKLIDFGIAKYVGCDLRTRTGLVKGKHCYMSPEQVRRDPLDHRSDIFSLGVILYELATGWRLFKGDSVFETMELVEAAEVDPLADVVPGFPEQLATIIDQCLARDPMMRPPSARRLARALSGMAGATRPQRIVSAVYRTLFGDSGTVEDEVTIAEYKQALRAAELGEAGKARDRERSDITLVVPDQSDLAVYVGELRGRLHHPQTVTAPAERVQTPITAH